jgi:hypothetical protein
MADNQWVSCSGQNSVSGRQLRLIDHNLTIGQDNPSTECIVGDVPNILLGDVINHDGPYDGVIIGIC